MAIGDRQLEILRITLTPQHNVISQYRYRIKANTPDESDWKLGVLQLPWAEFLTLLTNAEKAALVSIRDKMALQVKAKITLLGNAEVV